MLLRFENITFTHDSADAPIFENVSVDFSPGWTGIIGVNGSGKTTLLKLACGELEPSDGIVHSKGTLVYCKQRTDDPPTEFDDFLTAQEKSAFQLQGHFDIREDWSKRWATLSHGERKRAQIAVALWLEPQVLAIDEPTNHVDGVARDILAKALQSFNGIGLLVSHDRELLDLLCQSCLFIEPPTVNMRPGNYTQAKEQAQREIETNISRRKVAERSIKNLHREVTHRRAKASVADKKRSKRHISAKDHDAKDKINRARVTGKDGQAGRLTNQLKGRMRQMNQALEEMPVEKTYGSGIWLSGSFSKRKSLFNLEPGSIPLGDGRMLRHPRLFMTPVDRIGITGPNGGGKTSLVNHLLANLNIEKEKLVYVPQEIDLGRTREILKEVKLLPREQLGHVMTIVSRLGSRPHRLLQSTEASPGELRKILLALGIINEPHLIIMDEPTNHLDLLAIECLEQALTDCPCGLLLVSHDHYFLKHVADTRWHIEDGQLTVVNW